MYSAKSSQPNMASRNSWNSFDHLILNWQLLFFKQGRLVRKPLHNPLGRILTKVLSLKVCFCQQTMAVKDRNNKMSVPAKLKRLVWRISITSCTKRQDLLVTLLGPNRGNQQNHMWLTEWSDPIVQEREEMCIKTPLWRFSWVTTYFYFLWSLRFGAQVWVSLQVVSSSRSGSTLWCIEQAQLGCDFCENVCVILNINFFPIFLRDFSF